MYKKLVVTVLIISVLSVSLFAGPLFSIQKQDGGLVPCLTSIFDPRFGYLVNEKDTNVDLMDILKFIPVVNYVVMIANGITGMKGGGLIPGCCIGIQGYHTAHMMPKYNVRTVEWLMYIPIANFYSLFVVITETWGGKTWSEVVEKENLKK